MNKEKAIKPEHLESLIGHNRLFNAFAVIDAVTTGKVAQAVDRLRNLFATDKSAEYTVVGAFAYHFRKMFTAKALLDKGQSVSQVARAAGVWYNREAFFKQLREMTIQQIGSVIQELARIDYAIKTGRTTPKVAIEQLVLQLTTLTQRPDRQGG